MIENVSDKNFNEKVLNFKGLTVVDFWADWCGPCKMLSVVLEDIDKEFKSKINIKKINIDLNPKLKEKYKIMSIPTILIFLNGKLIDTIIGFLNKEELKERINNLI